MPLSDMDSTSNRPLGGFAKPLDDQLGKFSVSPDERIRIAGMVLASTIRKYIIARALSGKPLNWRERAQVIDATLADAKRYLRKLFVRDGEFEDEEPVTPVLGGKVPPARDDDPVHEVDEDRLGFGIKEE